MTQTVLLVGEALIDIVADGERTEEFVGGSPANAAIGVSRMGHRAKLLTRVGRDSRGERIAAHLAAEGVEMLEQSWTSEATATALAEIQSDGSARYTFDIRWSLPDSAPVDAELVHAGSLGLFLEPGGGEVLRLLRGRPRACLATLDPNVRGSLLPDRAAAVRRFEDAAAEVDLVKLSDEDAAWLYPGSSPEHVLGHIRSLGPRVVVMTQGPDGSRALSDVGEARVPAVSVSVIDTISAGDSFMACLISSLLERGVDEVSRSLGPVLERAACASAIAVSAAGANPPYRRDLDAMCESLQSGG